MNTILLVGEDASLLLNLRHALNENGFEAVIVRNIQQLAPSLVKHEPDLILLEVVRVDATTLNLCKRIRQQAGVDTLPIVVAAKRQTAEDVAQVLDAGADLFMAKPLVMSELVARTRALLRRRERTTSWNDQTLLEIDLQERAVRVNGRDVSLTPVEFELLNYLCQNTDRYHPAQLLLKSVWKYPDGAGDTALVRNHVRNLRFKIEDDPDRPKVIESLPKRGYRVNAVVRWVDTINA